MTVTVNNQKPTTLDPIHTIICHGDYEPLEALTKEVVQPILQAQLNPQKPVKIFNNQQDTTNDIADYLISCLGNTVQPDSEKIMKEVFGQTLIHFDQKTSLPIGELYAIQAGQKHKMPAPSPTILYTAREDVIPAAKSFLAGSTDSDQFFAALAYTFHPETLGFWFQTTEEFDNFKLWIQQTLNTSGLPPNTRKLIRDFHKLQLTDLTESLQIRHADSDGNEEYSFARLIINLLMTYANLQTSTGTVGVLPFSVNQLFCPHSVVFVNIEAHARAQANKITAEWKLINHSLASPLKIVSHQQLSKLTSLPRAISKASSIAASAQTSNQMARSAQVVFRKQPPTPVDLAKALTRVLKRMGKVNRSQNIFRKTKTSFLKSNRRDPDDFNKPGRITSVNYMPDLHIFVDTSGSITEINYQQSILMLIHIAKKLNINLFFNSFSDILSQETLLRVENKSVSRIWQEFRRVPKVDGGTDYLQIWRYINASPTRKRRLNLVITDFEWNPPSTREEHPQNLFYAPCGSMDWNHISSRAQSFTQSMKHIDQTIGQKLLGMIL